MCLFADGIGIVFISYYVYVGITSSNFEKMSEDNNIFAEAGICTHLV